MAPPGWGVDRAKARPPSDGMDKYLADMGPGQWLIWWIWLDISIKQIKTMGLNSHKTNKNWYLNLAELYTYSNSLKTENSYKIKPLGDDLHADSHHSSDIKAESSRIDDTCCHIVVTMVYPIPSTRPHTMNFALKRRESKTTWLLASWSINLKAASYFSQQVVLPLSGILLFLLPLPICFFLCLYLTPQAFVQCMAAIFCSLNCPRDCSIPLTSVYYLWSLDDTGSIPWLGWRSYHKHLKLDVWMNLSVVRAINPYWYVQVGSQSGVYPQPRRCSGLKWGIPQNRGACPACGRCTCCTCTAGDCALASAWGWNQPGSVLYGQNWAGKWWTWYVI